MCSSDFEAVHSSAHRAMPSSTSSACLLPASVVHVEHAGHDLVDRVERRPHRLARIQPVEQLDGEGAQIAARAELLLALGQLRDHVVGLGLGFLVARGGVELRAGGKEVADEVAAQFAFAIAPPPGVGAT